MYYSVFGMYRSVFVYHPVQCVPKNVSGCITVPTAEQTAVMEKAWEAATAGQGEEEERLLQLGAEGK